ncbi:energy transducer TonB [uncultured Desulfovibrio sp.]|uniref:energy transducer TonB n=1 Tax=uncultured Desulfovibrio sp. TaxID=167968 RepID=UPI002615C3FD|nr:energy transducer TonB [uncultured Desulfovibrio sp.]
MQNMLNNNVLSALSFVLVLHALVWTSACFLFTGSTALPIPQKEMGITVDFAVVPEDEPVSGPSEPAAAAPEPEPEPIVDSEPEPVIKAAQPAPKPQPKPTPKPRHVAQALPPAAAPAAGGSAPPTVNATPSPVVQKGAESGNAVVLQRVKPSYPALSLRKGEEGRVVLSVLVKADGTAGNVNIKRTSGFPRLDTAAENAVRRWRFEPYRIGGLATDHEYSVVVEFSLLDR